MGIDKNSILQAISMALDGMGLSDGSGDDMYGESDSVGGDNGVPIWSQLNAGTLGQSNGIIHDKNALMMSKDDAKTPPSTDAYGMPIDDQGDAMMSALGLV